MRASLVCCKNVSKVGRASWGKCSLRVRIRVVSRIKYYKNISTPRHPTWFPYYRSTTFPTQIFRDLLIVPTASGRSPCLMSFRHTFAVTCLQRWYQQGLDVQTLLPHLSVYLGHVHPQ